MFSDCVHWPCLQCARCDCGCNAGYRLIQGVKTKQTCIIAAMDQERHAKLKDILDNNVRAEKEDMNDQSKTMSKSWSGEASSKSSAVPTMGGHTFSYGNVVPQM